MVSNRSINILGKSFLVDLNVSGAVRKSPGKNARARCIAKKARGKNLEDRKKVFADECKIKGS